MTLQNQDSTVTHNGNGLTKVWPYAFRIPDPDALRVGLFDIATSALILIDPTEFTVTGLGDDDGGEVTYPLGFLDPIPATKRLVIYREVPYTQDIDLTNQTYYPETLEDQLDLIVMQIQKLAEEANRSLKVTLGASLEPDEFIAELQAGAAVATEQAGIATTQAAAAIAAAASVDAATIVHYTAEVKTAVEKLQAQTNIGAVGYDQATALTAAQQGQARANVGAGLMSNYRNKLINGNFDIWQRGSSFVIAAGSAAHTADRWLVRNATNQSVTVSLAAFSLTPTTDVPLEAKLALVATFAVAPTSGTLVIEQRVENVRTLSGKKVTSRTYIEGPASGAGTLSADLAQYFGTGGSPSATVTTTPTSLSNANITDASGRSRTAVFDLPNLAGKTLGSNNNDYLLLRWIMSPRAIGAYIIARTSLVEGDASMEPDPFSPRHIADEFRLCQRYREQGRWSGSGYAAGAGGQATAFLAFKADKRATPVTTVDSSLQATNVTSVAADNYTEANCRVSMTATAAGQFFAVGGFIADVEFAI